MLMKYTSDSRNAFQLPFIKFTFLKCIALLILPHVNTNDEILPVPTLGCTQPSDESRFGITGVCCEYDSAPEGHTADGKDNLEDVCNVIDIYAVTFYGNFLLSIH